MGRHWHPRWLPLTLTLLQLRRVRTRLRLLYPNSEEAPEVLGARQHRDIFSHTHSLSLSPVVSSSHFSCTSRVCPSLSFLLLFPLFHLSFSSFIPRCLRGVFICVYVGAGRSWVYASGFFSAARPCPLPPPSAPHSPLFISFNICFLCLVLPSTCPLQPPSGCPYSLAIASASSASPAQILMPIRLAFSTGSHFANWRTAQHKATRCTPTIRREREGTTLEKTIQLP